MPAKTKIELTDVVGGTVTIKRTGPTSWKVTQRNYGREHDNNQSPTWLRVENAGPATEVRVRLEWATSLWSGLRKIGYTRRGRTYGTVVGETKPTETVFTFTVPSGESWFGAHPWYSNEDTERFLRRMLRRGDACEVRSIGKTGEGREIPCLTVDAAPRRKGRPNVVVIGRTHATEPSGSFAVEGAAEHILSDDCPKARRNRYVFHFLPVANPDGTAHGLKLTRPGPVLEYDMVQGGRDSKDATIVALREELDRLRPACLISHHCYLQNVTFLGFFEQQVGADMWNALVKGRRDESPSWWLRYTGPEDRFLRHICYEKYGTTAVFTELPWQGRLPDDIRKLGAETLRALLLAHENKAASPRRRKKS